MHILDRSANLPEEGPDLFLGQWAPLLPPRLNQLGEVTTLAALEHQVHVVRLEEGGHHADNMRVLQRLVKVELTDAIAPGLPIHDLTDEHLGVQDDEGTHAQLLGLSVSGAVLYPRHCPRLCHPVSAMLKRSSSQCRKATFGLPSDPLSS